MIEQYKAIHWPNAKKLEIKDRAVGRNVTTNDQHSGYLAGLNAQLNRGVGGVAERKLLT